ncbi:MAG TPA: hypothetical protein VI564_03445 [Candidatus Nanoarchaeia archaeon]|nr:hypothetical protein [Candidatus Nanoarchaeia archaeon]
MKNKLANFILSLYLAASPGIGNATEDSGFQQNHSGTDNCSDVTKAKGMIPIHSLESAVAEGEFTSSLQETDNYLEYTVVLYAPNQTKKIRKAKIGSEEQLNSLMADRNGQINVVEVYEGQGQSKKKKPLLTAYKTPDGGKLFIDWPNSSKGKKHPYEMVICFNKWHPGQIISHGLGVYLNN